MARYPQTFIRPDTGEEYEREPERYLVIDLDGESVETYETLEEAKRYVEEEEPTYYVLDLETRLYHDWNSQTHRWRTDARPRG